MYEEYFKHVSTDVSEDIKKFVRDEVFGNSEYLFVTKTKDGNRGYCTKCNSEYDVKYVAHNERGICPACGASVTSKSTRYGRKNCKNEACFYYFEKSMADPEVVVCKGYYVAKDYDQSYKSPKTEYTLVAIYIFESGNTKMLESNWSYYNGSSWEERKSVYDFNRNGLAMKMCYCSFKSMEKAIQGTGFKYMPHKALQGHVSMVKLFEEYSKHPGIEYLIKEGFENLVEDKLKGYSTYSTVNWNGKTIFKILKINKLELREIKSKKICVTFEFLKVLQDAKKQKWGLSMEEAIEIASKYYAYYRTLKDASEYSSVKKLLKYFSKQYLKYNGAKKNRHYYDEGGVLNKFKDYVADCKILNMDVKREQVLFPKDLYTAHQNTTKQIKIKENKKYDAQIRKRARELEKNIFEKEGYLIRPAQSSLELIEEGTVLNHCVAAHYTIPYANGDTNIFLVRKSSEPNKPYCTVEVKDNKVRQAYIKDDKVPDKETLKFIDMFKSEKLQSEKR